MPIVSVVLCVRNGANTIDAQLEGLARQDYEGSWELVLVDNASTDGTRARVEAWRARLPQLRVVEESVVGSGGARNRGSRAVIGTRIACCDADDVVSPAWLREMLAALDRFDVVGVGSTRSR